MFDTWFLSGEVKGRMPLDREFYELTLAYEGLWCVEANR